MNTYVTRLLSLVSAALIVAAATTAASARTVSIASVSNGSVSLASSELAALRVESGTLVVTGEAGMRPSAASVEEAGGATLSWRVYQNFVFWMAWRDGARLARSLGLAARAAELEALAVAHGAAIRRAFCAPAETPESPWNTEIGKTGADPLSCAMLLASGFLSDAAAAAGPPSRIPRGRGRTARPNASPFTSQIPNQRRSRDFAFRPAFC